MPNRPILEIAVDDTAFQGFLQKFNEHQEMMKSLPSYWTAATSEIEKQKTSFEKISARIAATGGSSVAIERAQDNVSKLLEGAAISLGLLGTHGKHFSEHIVRSTQHLLKWTKLTSVFAGVIGAGGLFGIDRMAASVAGQRTSAAGLGISYTEQASFLANFRRLGNPEAILKGFSEALSTPFGKAQIAHLIGHQPTSDAAEAAAEALPKFKEFVDRTPDDQLAKRLEAFGYTKLGLGVEQAKVVRGMSREEIEAAVRGYREGKTSALALDPAMAKKWTDFTTQMELARRQIETVFAKDLVNLAPGLTDLSNAFVGLVDNLLKDGSPLKGWIDSLGKGLDKIAKTMGGRGFQDGVSLFVRDSTALIHLIERMTAMSLKDVLAVAYKGLYGAAKESLDSSRSEIEQRYGKDWTWHSGIQEPSTSPGPANRSGRPEDVYKPGGGGATRHQTERSEQGGTPPTRQSSAPATPSQNERAATSGSGARTQTPGGPGSPSSRPATSEMTPTLISTKSTSQSSGYGKGEPKPLDVVHGSTGGVDKRLLTDVAAGATHLPPGYKVRIFSGFRPGDPGAHGRGQAIDVEIVDPKGNVIPSRGGDPSHMYERLARSVYGEMKVRDPSLADKKLAWGGSFGTQKGGGGVSDLMHFDIMGRRGGVRASHFKQVQELGPVPLEERTLKNYGVGTHPADLERGKPTGVDINNHSDGTIDVH